MTEIKKKFRSTIKNQTLEFLIQQKNDRLHKMRTNKFGINMLSKDQRTLKKEIAELYRMIVEYQK